MFQPLEKISAEELKLRRDRLINNLNKILPEHQGIFVFSRLNLYYLSGTMAHGVLFISRDGEPILLCRQGIARTRLESSLENIREFKSYSQVPNILKEQGLFPKGPNALVGAEMNWLPWNLANLFQAKLPELTFKPADLAIAKTVSIKTAWELKKMRLAGQRQAKALREIIPKLIHPGQNELEIALLAQDVFFSLGHCGITRMASPGEEVLFGHVSAGDSGNYPSYFNGPLGVRGMHPAAPYLGYPGKIWQKNTPMMIDVGFVLEGYNTDCSLNYWAGRAEDIPAEAMRVQNFCEDVHEWLAENLKPGQIPSALYFHCLDWAKKEGLADSFMGYDGNQVVFVGHGIGLTIDSYPVLAKGFDDPLEEGMTIALEPKSCLTDFGCLGAEDTYLVTPQGGECLTGFKKGFICID